MESLVIYETLLDQLHKTYSRSAASGAHIHYFDNKRQTIRGYIQLIRLTEELGKDTDILRSKLRSELHELAKWVDKQMGTKYA